jgi:hypothetical protein
LAVSWGGGGGGGGGQSNAIVKMGISITKTTKNRKDLMFISFPSKKRRYLTVDEHILRNYLSESVTSFLIRQKTKTDPSWPVSLLAPQRHTSMQTFTG